MYYNVIQHLIDMKRAITVRLDPELQKRLDSVSETTGMSRSDIVRDALRRQLAVVAFEKHRRMTMPFAELQGYLTDEDIFRDIS